jgi:hypothetical protein
MRYVRSISVAALTACVCVLAQDLLLRRAGQELRVSAPRLHFLTGKPLERMRNGASVTYDMQMTIFGDTARQTVLRRGFERFVVSYDLWEETFSATRVRGTRTAASRMTAQQAESWCLEHLAVPATGLTETAPVYLRLDVRALEQRERRPSDEQEGISLGRLIDIFSKLGAPAPGNHWRAESGPILLRNLKP